MLLALPAGALDACGNLQTGWCEADEDAGAVSLWLFTPQNGTPACRAEKRARELRGAGREWCDLCGVIGRN